MYKVDFRYRQGVFGAVERAFTADEPYALVHEIDGCFELRPYLGDNTAMTVVHVESGASIRIKVNFFGRDEMDFSIPLVRNEARFDAWIMSVDPSWTAEPIVEGDRLFHKSA